MSLPNPLPPNSVSGTFVGETVHADGTTTLRCVVETKFYQALVQSQGAPHEPVVVIFD